MDPPCSSFRRHRRRRQSSSPSSETKTAASLTFSSSVHLLLFTLCASHVFSGNNPINPAMAFDLNTITFNQGYAPLFSDFNIYRTEDDKSVRLHLNRQSGSGIISMDYYNFGFFSAKIKLPRKYTAGIVVAFYTSNVDMFPTTHDELDMEFLGNVRGKPWRFQTNVYGNGSTIRGREERYRLWFDPSKEFHRYSILWARNKIILRVPTNPRATTNGLESSQVNLATKALAVPEFEPWIDEFPLHSPKVTSANHNPSGYN